MNKEPFIWANLLHLGYNMWCDHQTTEWTPPNTIAQPYLRCDKLLWDDLTQQMADSGLNMLVIDLGEGVRYDSHPELGVEGSWSPEFLRAEVAKLRQMGIEPIPKLNFSAAHDAWLGPYSRMLSTPHYYEVCRDLIREVIALFDAPRFFHIGMDEETAHHQRRLEYCVVRQFDLWWHDLFFYIDEVERAGVRAWMWSDYVWNHPETFFQKMPRSVLQSNWYYGEHFDGIPDEELDATYVRAYLQLEEHGYDQVPTGSNWSFDTNFEDTVKFCVRHIAPERLKGFMTAPWKATLEAERPAHVAAIEQVAHARVNIPSP